MPGTQLPSRSEDEKSRLRRVLDSMKQLLSQLREERRLACRGRFGELDRALGRKPGFLCLTLDGRERLSLERLLAALDFLGIHIAEFFAKIFPLRQVPPPAIGHLPRCKEPVRTQTRIPFRQDLLQWGKNVTVSPDGAGFQQDTAALLEVLQVNPLAAHRLAMAALEGLVTRRPASLTPEAADNLCRVLVPFADMMRVRGERNTACDLLDLAFRIESWLDDFSLRAFTYRTAAYLLSDLVRFADSEMFAERAIRLDTFAGNLDGLSRSLFVRGLMIWRQANCHEARPFFEAALRNSPTENNPFRGDIVFALANNELEAGRLESAESQLGEAEILLADRRPATRGKVILAQAELASLKGLQEKADALYAEAVDAFQTEASFEDIAFAGLKQVEHLLRWGRTTEATETAQTMLGLSEQIRSEGGSAIILEIVRLAVRGQLTAAVVKASIEQWQRPWLFRQD